MHLNFCCISLSVFQIFHQINGRREFISQHRSSVKEKGGLILCLPEPPDGLSTLQQSVTQWTNRGSVFALLPDTRLICLQIQIFDQQIKTYPQFLRCQCFKITEPQQKQCSLASMHLLSISAKTGALDITERGFGEMELRT